eukprot:CAMPEP_0198237362 /NCGR_PEP_ID=MMETSP1446-20131203/3216_1 /TAXON_ID=1461542 ORGANISM="Unidentified sp, Strain CCMP2111" /NCGR_SAMPLE_ID=MMETSP1446 /ASSEMBLY_ACC=CAM_ASM_001112 /LENGTH=661 /DNA_ID=CAMNT_0043919495 /DNA_START=268 /DNA_END=2250 /DNA_ORIENTATION=-
MTSQQGTWDAMREAKQEAKDSGYQGGVGEPVNDPDPEGTANMIQKIQREELVESGEWDAMREAKHEAKDDDYQPSKEDREATTTATAAGADAGASADAGAAGAGVVPPAATTAGDADADCDSEDTNPAEAPVPIDTIEDSPTSAPAVQETRKRPKSAPSRGVSLSELMREGYVDAGEGVFSCTYKEQTFTAELRESGVIRFEGNTFESPSAWSIFVKRKLNPGKKADDGWKSVMYAGKKLEHYKHEYLKKTYGIGTSTADDNEGNGKDKSAKNLPKVKIGLNKKAKRSKLMDYMEEPEYYHVPQLKPTTEYARNRPRREAKAKKQWTKINFASQEDEHRMIPLEHFNGVPGSGAEGAQPFQVEVSCGAEIMMDIHAHMSEKHEIIGLLGGLWDPQSKKLTVEGAFPVKELGTEDNTINVEMDPESEVKVRDQIKKDGMVCVGWYHSHPCFAAIPSVIDLKNQLSYQRLVRDESSMMEPFVAGIVSPYNPNSDGVASAFTWFYVCHQNQGQAASDGFGAELNSDCYAMSIDIEHKEANQLIASIMEKVKPLSSMYASRESRTDWDSPWFVDGAPLDQEVPQGTATADANADGAANNANVDRPEVMNKLQKMMKSLAHLLPPSWRGTIANTFLSAIKMAITATWDKTAARAQLDEIKLQNEWM